MLNFFFHNEPVKVLMNGQMNTFSDHSVKLFILVLHVDMLPSKTFQPL